jgi:hypothetical protein
MWKWKISHRPIFGFPFAEGFPTLRQHVYLLIGGFIIFMALSTYMRGNHIEGQWVTLIWYLLRDAGEAFIHPGS